MFGSQLALLKGYAELPHFVLNTRFITRALIWMWLTVAVLGAAAQSSSERRDSDKKQPTKTAADYPDEPVIYEFVRGSMHYENDGTGTREVKAVLRVQSAAGLETAGQLVFDYNAASERMEIRSVTVTKQDGTVIQTGPENVQDLSAPVAREAPVYTDAREKHVTVTGVAVGDTVEYDVLTTIFQPLMAGQFWENWKFVSRSICLDEQVDLNVPNGRAIKLKSPSGVDPVVREEGERRIYHWATSNLHHRDPGDLFKNFNFDRFDARSMLMGPRYAPGQQLMFSTFHSWEEVGRWYAELERERRVVTPEIQARADAIVQDKTTELAKAQALYEWVAQNVRYVSLSFGVGRYQPHAAAEILRNRYGDCKDKTTLLEALLEAEGIHAQAVLINSTTDVDSDLPTPLQFDHAITMVKLAGKDFWLDSTLGVGPFSYLMPQLRDKEALVVFTDVAPGLQKTPAQPPMALYGFEITGEMKNAHEMDATLGIEIRGDWEVLMRMGFLKMPPAQMSNLLQVMATQANKSKEENFSFSDLKTSDPTDISKPFHISFHFTAKSEDTGTQSQRRRDKDSSTMGLMRVLSSPDSFEELPLTMLLPESADKLDGAREYSLKLKFTAPFVEHENTSKPFNVHIGRDFAEYDWTGSWENNTAHLAVRLKLDIAQPSSGQQKEYAAFRKEVVASVAEMARSYAAARKAENAGSKMSVSPSESISGIPLATTALYGKAIEAMKAENWSSAEQELESVVKDAPNWDYAWSNLGRTRMALRKYSEAEIAFRKYLELAPKISAAYQMLASSLTSQQKYAEAAEILDKALLVDSQNQGTLLQLGFIHLRLHQTDRALTVLETATRLYPQNPVGQYLLGHAYLESHQNEKGIAAVQRAVALNDSDSILNDSAYVLAETNTRLDLAEPWSIRSISKIADELNTTTLDSIQPKTAALLYKAALYWDTLGWIKFQKKDFEAAEKYVHAAWILTEDTTIGIHLGRVYEAQGNKEAAIEAFAQAIASAPNGRPATEVEKDAKARLTSLLGQAALVETRINQSRIRARERRSVAVSNSAGMEGMAQYLVIVGPGSKLTDIRRTISDNQLDGLTDNLRAAILPQTLPDDTISKIPATAVLACPSADQPCRLSLFSAEAEARTFPSPPEVGQVTKP